MSKIMFEFELPEGFIDKEGNIHKKGIMHLSTAADEIKPLRDPRVKNNESYIIIILLSRVIDKLGDLKNVNTSIIEQLSSIDLDFLKTFIKK